MPSVVERHRPIDFRDATNMSHSHITRRLVAVMAAAAVVVTTQHVVGQTEPVDLQAIYKIKEEGLQRSKVMEIASYLTDVYGPRLTGTPEIRRAGEWAVKEMQAWGLVNVRLEPWTGFGRGWSNDRFSAQMTAPSNAALIGYPKAWTPGTNGLVKGEAIEARLETPADLEKWRGQLKGKFVLTAPPRAVTPRFIPQAERYTNAELEELARQPISTGRGRGGAPNTGSTLAFARERTAFLVAEGVLATIEP